MVISHRSQLSFYRSGTVKMKYTHAKWFAWCLKLQKLCVLIFQLSKIDKIISLFMLVEEKVFFSLIDFMTQFHLKTFSLSDERARKNHLDKSWISKRRKNGRTGKSTITKVLTQFTMPKKLHYSKCFALKIAATRWILYSYKLECCLRWNEGQQHYSNQHVYHSTRSPPSILLATTLASAAGAARIRILLSTNNKRTTVFFGCSSNRMKTCVWRALNERTPTFFVKALSCTAQRMIKDIRRKRGTRNKFARILFLRSLASTVSVHEFFIHAFHISTDCFNSLSLSLFFNLANFTVQKRIINWKHGFINI